MTKNDIILRSSLDKIAEKNKNLTMWYTVDKCDDECWPYTVGFMSAELFKQKLPAPGPNTMILLCGPPGLIGFATKQLTSIGYTDDMLFTF
jgi:cytochrome-b5 reductase